MFVRSKRYPLGRQFRPATVRLMFAGMYLLYPAGCIMQLVTGPAQVEAAYDLAGLLVVAVSLLIFAMLAGSSLQRQSQEQETMLDERELMERNRAAYGAHSIFAAIVLLGIIYLMIGNDLVANGKLAVWLPETGSHWNGVFWGLLLAALTLPSAVLAWRKSPAEPEFE
ncbi:MAG: hypothetical protein Q8R82_06450 [Hyphomonadaceae bacterium]|nr:hypothetical protein [Hyphomonadaceae bacterium]